MTMTEHADPIFPVLWTSQTSRTHEQGPTAVRAGSAAQLAGGVYALLLRYAGLRDLVVRVRHAAEAPWAALDLRVARALVDGGAPTVGSCRAALREAWSGHGDDPGYLEMTVGTEEPESISLEFSRRSDGLWTIRVKAQLLPADPDVLGRIAAHATAFLESDDSQPIDAVEHLTAAERAVLLDAGATDRPLPTHRCIHQLVEAAVDSSPERIAVIQDDQRLTYRELDERANALALTLIGQGAGVGARVGLVATRSAEFVVAALAVLKAGAAYVPLDPHLPRQRRELLHRLGKVDLLVADADHEAEAAEHADSWTVLEPAARMASAPRADLPSSRVRGEDLAYVIFTSGSSGEPKGALLDHLGRANMIEDLNERLGLAPDDRVLVVSSPSFDMSVYDIFGALAAGAAVVLPARGRENDVEHWADLVVRHRPTVWHSVPSSLSLVLNAWRDRPSDSLRLFLLGGDWIPLTQPDEIRSAFPRARVISLGGATEVSVDSVIFEVAEVDPRWRSIPYGRPLANQAAYVLDGYGARAALDQVGELYLGGVGVGWGYQDRPGFTAERFVPDPFGRVPGRRLYRTGDLARMRPDGNLELIGRTDSQVKVGGVRIELGEIQACLRRLAAVQDAIVVPVRDTAGAVRLLAAFLTRAGGGGWAGDEQSLGSVRAHLAESLPAAMVPARITILDELPVNQNGKVDRGSLERLAAQAATARETVVDSAVTQAVAGIWQDVLGLPGLPGPQDSFFDLGGSSLAAIQVVGRLNRRFDVDVKVADLLHAETVGQVAVKVMEQSNRGRGRPALRR